MYDIAESLHFVASRLRAAPDAEPWDHGWSHEEYRRSSRAAISGAAGPVAIAGEALVPLEQAVDALRASPGIRDRWDGDELWAMVVSLIALGGHEGKSVPELADILTCLAGAPKALVITLIANVRWEGPPVEIGDAVLGGADRKFLLAVNTAAGPRQTITEDWASRWLAAEIEPRGFEPQPVALASWTLGQDELARQESARLVEDIVSLSLLLEPDPLGHKIYRRGSTNRPGVRGLTLDRGAVERGLLDTAKIELTSRPLVVRGLVSLGQTTSWYGAEPLPLADLLRQPCVFTAVGSCFDEDPVSNSIRIAARWFAEAHYALAEDDAALALGVALDALLTGKRSMSGGAMADRFALLTPNTEERPLRAKQYLDLYGVRSSVAHGGRSSKLDDPPFLAAYQDAVKWAAWRCIALRDQFAPGGPNEVDAVFDRLKWGLDTWVPTPGASSHPG